MLEIYLDKPIEPKEYQIKKNELIKEKLSLIQQIKEIEDKGNDWLEPFSQFIKEAALAAKIARAKNNLHELSLCAKKVGSNFILKDRQLSVDYHKRGWLALAAAPFAASATAFFPKLLRTVDKVSTYFKTNSFDIPLFPIPTKLQFAVSQT